MPADVDLLGEPVSGRLLFAGEHTQSARTGYADGAMTSGIREAKRLLGLPGIHLGPVNAAHLSRPLPRSGRPTVTRRPAPGPADRNPAPGSGPGDRNPAHGSGRPVVP